MLTTPLSEIDARFAAFALMERCALPVPQMWALLGPYLPRRVARRRRPTWSRVHECLTDLLLSASLLDQAERRVDPAPLVVVFAGGAAAGRGVAR